MLRTHRSFQPTDDGPQPAANGTSEPASAIDAWLNVFVRMLRLPEAQRQAIRSELHEHLSERVRDLLLVGRSETESVRLAIEELGETLQLARRFEAANRPRIRRWLMNLALIGIASGAIFVSAITLSPTSPSSPAVVFQEQDEVTKAAFEQLNELRISKVLTDAYVDAAVKVMTEDLPVTVILHKAELEAVDAFGQALTYEFKNTPLPKALDVIVGELSRGGLTIDWRVTDANTIEIGVKSELDRRDITLVSYDIRGIITSICNSFNQPYDNAVADVTSLLFHMVDPDAWRENGGDLAHLQVVGGRMFVQAPQRMHKSIEWILQQLRDDAENAGRDNKQGDRDKPPVLGDMPLIQELRKESARKSIEP
jgi:hypothetical protein